MKTTWHQSHINHWTDVFQWDEYDTLKNPFLSYEGKKSWDGGNGAGKRYLVKKKKHFRLPIGKYILKYSAIT